MVGAYANPIGVSVGFFYPSLFINDDDISDHDQAKVYMKNMLILPSAVSSVIMLGVILFYKNKPPTPPTLSKVKDTTELTNFSEDMRALMKNIPNILATLSSTFTLSYVFVITTIIDPIARIYDFNS